MPILPSGLKVCLDFTGVNNLIKDDMSLEFKECETLYVVYKYIMVYELKFSNKPIEGFTVNLLKGSEPFDLSLFPKSHGFNLANVSGGMTMWCIEDQISFDIFIDMKKTQDIIKEYLNRSKIDTQFDKLLSFNGKIRDIYF